MLDVTTAMLDAECHNSLYLVLAVTMCRKGSIKKLVLLHAVQSPGMSWKTPKRSWKPAEMFCTNSVLYIRPGSPNAGREEHMGLLV